MVLLALALLAPTVISPVDPRIRYVGRWDFSDEKGPRCEWTASMVEIRFHGTGLDADFVPCRAFWEAEVDGVVGQKFAPVSGGRFSVASHLPNGHHVVRLYRDTEAATGPTQILDYAVPNGGLDKPLAPTRRFEVIGDSISCGYGDEGANAKEHFSLLTEDAYLTYGAVAARKVDADYTCVAWSGRKMWPDNTIPEIYDLSLPTLGVVWRFGRSEDAYVINLGTNDFGKGNPDRAGWTNAYAKFIGKLREHSPKARIYCAVGPMMSDNYPPTQQARTTLISYLGDVLAKRKQAGDDNLAIIDFGVQDIAKNGVGADYHPNVKTHREMASRLIDQFRLDLRW